LCAPIARADTTVTLLQFADYHSHAIPFYSEGRPDQGGLARAIRYLRQQKRHGALVFSGGDMINSGSPSWSDKYRCTEWPWLDGIVDAMAFGNHDSDYGAEVFAQCRKSVSWPILSANTSGFRPYVVLSVRKMRIGVFAVAGPDFPALVKTPGLTFSSSVDAARGVVRKLRDVEHVDAVVLIGHEHLADDFALARAVPGIDLIFGSHSHLERDLQKIDGTSTWYISPFQYLTYISRVELTFHNHELRAIRGGLVRVDSAMPADPPLQRKIDTMERELERDPAYAPLFNPIAVVPRLIPVAQVATMTVEVMRDVANADVALSTASSFRQDIAPGPLTLESLRAALPYDNEIVVDSMSGVELQKLLAFGASLAGSDSLAVVAGGETIDPAKTYRVATTDFLAHVAGGYRDFFRGRSEEKSGLRVREELRKRLAGP
jgi:5'-nucleotidase